VNYVQVLNILEWFRQWFKMFQVSCWAE